MRGLGARGRDVRILPVWASWLLRSNFVADLLARRNGGFSLSPGRLFRGLNVPEHRVRATLMLLLDGDVGEESAARLQALAARQRGFSERDACELLHAAACLPEYQLS